MVRKYDDQNAIGILLHGDYLVLNPTWQIFLEMEMVTARSCLCYLKHTPLIKHDFWDNL
jgi:predicted metalloprotease